MSKLNITEEEVIVLCSEAGREMNYCDQKFEYDKEITVTQQCKSRIDKVLTRRSASSPPSSSGTRTRSPTPGRSWKRRSARAGWGCPRKSRRSAGSQGLPDATKEYISRKDAITMYNLVKVMEEMLARAPKKLTPEFQYCLFVRLVKLVNIFLAGLNRSK